MSLTRNEIGSSALHTFDYIFDQFWNMQTTNKFPDLNYGEYKSDGLVCSAVEFQELLKANNCNEDHH